MTGSTATQTGSFVHTAKTTSGAFSSSWDLEADRKAFLKKALDDAMQEREQAPSDTKGMVSFSDNLLYAALTLISDDGGWCQVSMTSAQIVAYHEVLGEMRKRRGL